MANSDFRTTKCLESKRLVYYMSSPDARFWDDHWQPSELSRKDYARAEEGDLWRYEDTFTKYLPKGKPILEAGCGLGKLVLALEVRGYSVEGVEWAGETVAAVRGLFPALSIRSGDVLSLDVPDGYYGGYISLGVVEHRRDGPLPFLQEAFRVLSHDGVALISVPHLNLLRSTKARMGLYASKSDGATFYQYAFTSAEFEGFLKQAGFRVEDRFGYDSYKSIVDEIPLARRWTKHRPVRSALRRLTRSKALERHLSHMMLYVCRPVKKSA